MKRLATILALVLLTVSLLATTGCVRHGSGYGSHSGSGAC